MEKQSQEPSTLKDDDDALSDKDLLERLRLPSDEKETISDLYQLSSKLLDEEENRRTTLDSKSYNLAGVAGICLTLTFSGGGLLLDKLRNGLSLPWFTIFVCFYIGASLLNLFSLIMALWVTKPIDYYRTLGKEDLFRECEMTSKENKYKRYLIAHFWKVYEENFSVNQEKGKQLKIAYRLFAYSLALLSSMAIMVGFYYIN